MVDPSRRDARGLRVSQSFEAFRSELLLKLSRDIVLNGFAFVPVGFGQCSAPGCECGDDDDSWAYTVGLAEQGLPELVVIGLAPVHAHELVRRVHQHRREVGPVNLGVGYWLDGVLVKLVTVPPVWVAHDLDRMSMWVSHYGPGRSSLTIPPVAQLLFADADGRFPDDPACDPVVAACQPLLAADPYSYPALLHRRTKRRSVIRRSAA